MNPSIFDPAIFDPGYVLVSEKIRGAQDEGLLIDPLIARHCRGDWGQVPDVVRRINEHGVANDLSNRVHSVFETKAFGPVWVVTERHPSLFQNTQTTFVLKPEEYPPNTNS